MLEMVSIAYMPIFKKRVNRKIEQPYFNHKTLVLKTQLILTTLSAQEQCSRSSEYVVTTSILIKKSYTYGTDAAIQREHVKFI